MIQFEEPSYLYKPQPGDVYVQLNNGGPGSDGEPININLNAIEYYARLGMKPKGMHALVGTTAMTIFNNGKLREAYERGRAVHELEARTTLYRNMDETALTLLQRTAGSAEIDAMNGDPPEERTAVQEVIKVKLEVEDTSDDPEIQALRQLLDDRVAEAVAKEKK